MKKCFCGKRSVPGLISSVALCQDHFNKLFYGNAAERRDTENKMKIAQDKKEIAK